MSFAPEDSDRVEALIILIAEDRARGLIELQKLAEQGNQWAILQLGLYLSEEAETTEAAIPWLLMANDFDSADAAWTLAMTARERGMIDEMKRWIDRAADLGEEDAMETRANGYDVDAVLAKYST